MVNKVIVILGPTASGKTKVGVKLAVKFNGEIISADSRQVYQGMDVGTGKDLGEYNFKIQNPKSKSISKSKIQKIPYHLVDVVKPKTEFNVAKYQKLAYQAIEDVLSRGKVPVIVGGTGLYIDAVVEGYQFSQCQMSNVKCQKLRKELNKLTLKQLLGRLKKLDPETYEIIDQKNQRRVQRALEIYYQTGLPKSQVLRKKKPPYQFLKIGINWPLEVLAKRIDQRLVERLEKEGMIKEVKRLHQQGVSWQRLEEFGLEYKWVSWYLQKKVNYDEMVKGLSQEIKKFAKRQMTWFKRDQEIKWLRNYGKIEGVVRDFLK